jgi:hypothetical protein
MEPSLFVKSPTRVRSHRRSRVVLLIAALLLVAVASTVYLAWITGRETTDATDRVLVSAAELNDHYGLRLKLIGVTAGGGLVDFRLKIVDADKARQILGNPDRTPGLLVAGSDAPLSVPRPTDHDLQARLVDDNVFISLIPNSDSIVKPGTPVVVTFGDLELEPVLAQ